jgi:plastocyanin
MRALMSRRNLRRSAASVAVLFVAAQLAGCISERAPTEPATSLEGCTVPGEAIGPNRVIVALRDYSFLPDTIRISAGTTVYWVNCDNVARVDAHTTTSDDGEWDSPLFVEGEYYQRTFAEAGVYDYHCNPHAFMRGTVIVE